MNHHVVVIMPPERDKREEFIKWYNEKYTPTLLLSGMSSCYLIPYVKNRSCGNRCNKYYQKAPRITFEQWRQQYCTEHYEIY